MTTVMALPSRALSDGRFRIAGGATALFSAVAAGAHLAALPAHRREGLSVAAFFVTVGALQLMAAIVVIYRGGGTPVRTAIVAGNITLVALWAWSRTTGLPVGAHAGLPEPVGLLDATAVAAHVLTVAALVSSSRSRAPGGPVPGMVVPGMVTVVLLALVVAAGGSRLMPASHHEHNAPEPAVEHYEPAVAVVSPSPSDDPMTPAEPAAPTEHSVSDPAGHSHHGRGS